MKKTLKRRSMVILLLLSMMLVFCFCSCSSSLGASDITGVDSLPGKTIGTQLGTVGDIYASDYTKEGSVIKQYNKGADAIMALKQGKVCCTENRS